MPAEVAPDLGKEMAAMGPTVNKKCHKGGKEDTGANAPRKETPADVSDPDPLSFAKPQSHPERDVAQSSEVPTRHMATIKVQDLVSAEIPESGKLASISSGDGLPGGIYQPGWGMINSCRLDTPDACQDVVDHIAPPGAKIAKHDQRILMREVEIKKLNQEVKSLQSVEIEVHGLRIRTKNLETLLEAEVDIKKAAEAKNT
ncbi:hypothetical protein Tco_1249042 [Tanacetum coccineum]